MYLTQYPCQKTHQELFLVIFHKHSVDSIESLFCFTTIYLSEAVEEVPMEMIIEVGRFPEEKEGETR
jgi:hypothetical protein